MATGQTKKICQRLPGWLSKPILANAGTRQVAAVLRRLELNTVCQSAHCPNKGECFSRGTATFMILGNVCTRGCSFCAVTKGQPTPVDSDEPRRVAQGAEELGLRYVVITSVTRDDLPDGGAGQFAGVVHALRRLLRAPRVEVLTPDFRGDFAALATVVDAAPDVFNHNVETVPRLYGLLRPQADYHRSLGVLERARAMDSAMVTKSGIMVGLGERRHEILTVMRDLRQAGCRVLTIGQYLCPSHRHYPVQEFITPQVFEEYRLMAQDQGFLNVYSAPFVRSSFHAEDLFNTFSQRRKRNEDKHHCQTFRDNQRVGRSRSESIVDPEKKFREHHPCPRYPLRGEISTHRRDHDEGLRVHPGQQGGIREHVYSHRSRGGQAGTPGQTVQAETSKS